jgi:Protein of unknown function (DUF3808)
MSSEWEECIRNVKTGLSDIVSNRFKETDVFFAQLFVEAKKAGVSDQGILAIYKLGSACVGLAEGLTAGALDRLSSCLEILWEAEDLANTSSRHWVGNALTRGVCLLFGGLIQVIQQSWVKAGINLTKAWVIIRSCLVEALDYRGPERELVRSLALFLVGALNMVVSVLPSNLLSFVELAGFDGNRSKALSSLETCRTESGPFSPFAGIVTLNFLVYVKPFLMEVVKTGDLHDAQVIVDWAMKKFPDSYFYKMGHASLCMTSRDPAQAVVVLTGVAESATEVPTLQMLLYYRRGLANICAGCFEAAAADFHSGVAVGIKAGRQSYVPFMCMLELCCLKTLSPEADISSQTEVIEKMRVDIDKENTWLPSDKWSFRRSEEYKSFEAPPPYTLDLFYAGILNFSCTLDKTPATVRDETITPLLNKLPADAQLGDVAKRQLIRAEILRLGGRRGEALDALDSILDRSDVEFKGFERDALRQLSLVWQALLFAQAAEPEAAQEALKDLDDWQLRNAGILGHVNLASGQESDFDVVLKFKRQGVQRMIESSGFQSAESSAPE